MILVDTRSLGVTVRATVDVIIATRCIQDGYRLLHSDRVFNAFEQHLGLQAVDCDELESDGLVPEDPEDA